MNRRTYISQFSLILVLFAGLSLLHAQPTQIKSAAEIELALRKLRVLGSALYIAAHPDDENTAVLSYLSKEKLVRTAYLSLTRGEGGQNLIGSEKGDALGALRTGELSSARRIDGAMQFFTSASDFGYSKSSTETLNKWDKDKILGEIVWTIRSFRPDVIITRFTESRGGHGHHLSSAILAQEAFRAAADPSVYPSQLQYVSPWKAKRIVWNAWNPDVTNRSEGSPPIISIDLGILNPYLGKSYMELAALSRSMHKSQGFGVSAQRGSYLNYFEHLDGTPAQADLFDDIDVSWQRVEHTGYIDSLILATQSSFRADTPYVILDQLLAIRAELLNLKSGFWKDEKLKEIDSIIQSCCGLWLEGLADDFYVSPGDSLSINMRIINRAPVSLILDKIRLPFSGEWIELNTALETNNPYEVTQRILLSPEIGFTSSGWLSPESKSQEKRECEFIISVGNQKISYILPLLYRWTDRVKGELYRPVEIGPPVSIEINGSAVVFTNEAPKELSVNLHAQTDSISGSLSLAVPSGWRCEPEGIRFSLSPAYQFRNISFKITPPAEETHSRVSAIVKTDGQIYNRTVQVIMYDHIETQTRFPAAEADLVHVNLKKAGDTIAYIMGSGDEIPQSLEQIGYSVHILSDEEIAEADLSVYDAIITGTRAYNVRNSLKTNHTKLLSYVDQGGTLITLHNTRFGLPVENTGPYPIQISRIRVSDEGAPITFLKPDHPLLLYPNKITPADFDNWVQERGLYFASEWDSNYVALFSCNDPGEEPHHGGFLYTRYGNGHYIFSPLSWFRQLPAGVAGAYRLFANMISVGKDSNGRLHRTNR